MNWINLVIGFVFFIAAGIILALAANAITKRFKRPPRYSQRPIMTNNELDFFYRLVHANSGGYVFAQVAMSALIQPATKDRKQRVSAFNRIARKRVDYAIYTETLDLLCVVELDDRTHNSNKDVERDAMLASAGIQTIRWQSRNKPEVEEIRKALDTLRPLPVEAPSVPATSIRMNAAADPAHPLAASTE